MNRIILQLFAVGFCVALGQALKCYKCDFGIGSLCITSETTCESGEHCFIGYGKAAGFVDIKVKGCIAEAKCNKTEDTTFNVAGSNATIYTLTTKCCNTDLCNAAPGLPGSSGLSLALASISALFVATYVV
ncbi:sperm acrosome membrane-associated protein 4 [Mugil cephalus]|uniref:sperm acrosome membrane-associated protein 4 n=1 Tax=Mugil cephalus TaxID=48193 RepID=UPI001FB704EF|nr:sperm acrosome membrane-associated protein 4 [Mugil cephalus]